MSRTLTAAAILALSTACNGLLQTDAIGPFTGVSPLIPAVLVAQPGRLEDPLLALAREVPGFGGLYQHSETRQYIATSATDIDDEQVRIVASRYFGVEPERVTVFRVSYSYAQLYAWRSGAASAASGVLVRLGLSSRLNKVILGVKEGTDLDGVLRSIEQLGIPLDAIDIRVEPPMILNQATVASKYCPLASEFRVLVEGTGSCTLPGAFSSMTG